MLPARAPAITPTWADCWSTRSRSGRLSVRSASCIRSSTPICSWRPALLTTSARLVSSPTAPRVAGSATRGRCFTATLTIGAAADRAGRRVPWSRRGAWRCFIACSATTGRRRRGGRGAPDPGSRRRRRWRWRGSTRSTLQSRAPSSTASLVIRRRVGGGCACAPTGGAWPAGGARARGPAGAGHRKRAASRLQQRLAGDAAAAFRCAGTILSLVPMASGWMKAVEFNHDRMQQAADPDL